MDMQELRTRIDEVDDEILALFEKRMKIAGEIGKYKKENGLPILDTERERKKLANVVEKAEQNMKSYAKILFADLFEMSRSYQHRLNSPKTELVKSIEAAVNNTEKVFPKHAVIACQGVEGAYSQQACDRLFDTANIMFFSNFEGVFSAIDKGMCKYGVLPLENSTAGSVNKIYDLMMKYRFNIVKSVRLKINHSLLVKKGTKLENVREIFSHEQAISQCAEYLKTLDNVKITVCENTAVAAKMVAESERTDIAAIASNSCATLYNMEVAARAIQDKGNNYTRFICISKAIEIYPGADRTSVMMILPHKPGALYCVLAKLFVLGINLVKLESRPMPDRSFEFMFYFDLETSVYSEEFVQFINELDELGEEFKYLGSYSELV